MDIETLEKANNIRSEISGLENVLNHFTKQMANHGRCQNIQLKFEGGTAYNVTLTSSNDPAIEKIGTHLRDEYMSNIRRRINTLEKQFKNLK